MQVSRNNNFLFIFLSFLQQVTLCFKIVIPAYPFFLKVVDTDRYIILKKKSFITKESLLQKSKNENVTLLSFTF